MSIILKKEKEDLINCRYAENIYKSIKNYNVELKIEQAVELTAYEDFLNNLIKADTIDLPEGAKLLRTLNNEEKTSIIQNAKNELKAIDSIQEYINKN